MKTHRPRMTFRKMLEAAQARFRRARLGSVLVMVVSLLLLLALIGTAAVSKARLDRYASRTDVSNTQIDMLVQGVREMVIGNLVDDLFGMTRFTKYDTARVTP